MNKKIESPEKLLKIFDRYKDWQIEYGDSRPMTMLGFEKYLSQAGLIGNLKDYFSNREKRYTAFNDACAEIKKAIYQDQVKGGMIANRSHEFTDI